MSASMTLSGTAQKPFLLIAFLVVTTHVGYSAIINSTGISSLEAYTLYAALDSSHFEKPPYDLFERGLTGLRQLHATGELSDRQLITLVDFRKSANEKRLWVIDLENKKILYHSLVAHGKNSGELYASRFSNALNSYQSSLGFYVTGKIYTGKHGTSLKLHGMESGINDLAETRSIVLHGAEYVSESFINKTGRLGRSFGCPAVPLTIHKQLIQEISNGTCLFIFYPDENYLNTSSF